MKRQFAIRHAESKELYAIVSVNGSKNIRLEQARLWDELDTEIDPFALEYIVMEKVDKWLMPEGDWLSFDLSADDYYKLLNK